MISVVLPLFSDIRPETSDTTVRTFVSDVRPETHGGGGIKCLDMPVSGKTHWKKGKNYDKTYFFCVAVALYGSEFCTMAGNGNNHRDRSQHSC